MPLDAVEVRLDTDDDEISGVGHSAAMKFQGEQECWLRNPPVETFGYVEGVDDAVFPKIPIRPLCICLPTTKRIDQGLELHFVLPDWLFD